MSEKTLCIIKPDAVQNNFVEEINKMIQQKDISILKSKFEKKLLNQSGLLSLKPKIFVCNVVEQSIQKGNNYTKKFLDKYYNRNCQKILCRAFRKAFLQ